ncbi:MAG TPA: TolC family protein, partial [Desulfuromonadaceae bacterium]
MLNRKKANLRRLFSAILLICLILSGCMVGPDYRRPEVEAPQSWRFAEKEARDLANTPWWEQFNDPALNELIVIAINENKDLKIAAARVEEFRGRYYVTRAPLFPQIGAGASAGGERTTEFGQTRPAATTTNPSELYQANFFATWEIDLWGKLRRATEAARADLLATEEAKRGVILSLVTSVASAYVNLLD